LTRTWLPIREEPDLQVPLYKQSDASQFIALLEDMKKKNPEMRFAYEYDEEAEQSGSEQELARVVVQTPQMKRNYELYHDTVFMDATYATNPYRMALVVLSGINNEGKNCILGYALLKRETLESYTWLLTHISRFNHPGEPGGGPNVLLTDFDPSMAGAIERVLPRTTHLLC